ncbi:MAG: hypothetical protein GY697_12920 [Desulfobacterales bacterium]|nr:hypothetical protein [Desulfobacterales bacterium]
MKNIQKTLLVLLLLIFTVAGCTALDINKANRDLLDLYKEKVVHEKAGLGNWEKLVSVKAALSDLANSSGERCRDENISELNRISFCRVATTAAWQSENKNLLSFSDEGVSICNKNNNYNLAPRDCAMVLIIPNFAAVGELGKHYTKLKDSLVNDQSANSADFLTLYNKMRDRLHSLLKSHASIKNTKVHPEVIVHIENQLVIIFTDYFHGLYAHIDTSSGEDTATCDLYRLEHKLNDIGLDKKIKNYATPKLAEKLKKCKN